ncbi:MAG: SLOG family protein [Candidatus Thermoplasmatota archaeon]|nr:SLOG family protein [Candidatus Thermoplasmatota archaeon]MEE3315804.1 SLOG family protein [Candidatus Thermoplasmatota archaeon]
MAGTSGQDTVERLGSQDLNRDGEIINLAIVGSSRFYDFMIFEGAVESWIDENGYPDMIIVGGASGVDYMAERWADNNSVPIAVFAEEWGNPTRSLVDTGRAEAPNTLTEKILGGASHILAMPSPTSKWTRIVIDRASSMGIPTTVLEVD